MSGTCFACGRPGHRRADCDTRLAPPLTVIPAQPGTPAPAQGSARPADWRIPGINYRPPEEWATDPHFHAEHARALLTARGIVIDVPDWRERHCKLVALEDLASRGRISMQEYDQAKSGIAGERISA